MVRFVIIGIVIAVAFTLYALVDAAMTDGSRARGVSKPVWIVIVVLLPVIGGVLWFMIGKGATPAKRPKAPDDDPRFTGTSMSRDAVNEHMRDLEERLRELDDEVYPGEEQPNAQDRSAAQSNADPAAGGSGSESAPDPAPHEAPGDAVDDAIEDSPEGPEPEVKPKPDGDAGAARK